MSQTSVTTRARRQWSRAVGALAGQLTLALGSFVLQLLAARSLGVDGFGVFALLFGSIVMATAVSTGLVGDSLTVLDRGDPMIRSALARTAAVTITLASSTGLALVAVLSDVDPGSVIAFAAATAAFMAADLVRRLLMASLRFWHLVLMDTFGFAAAMVALALFAMTGPLGLGHFLVALAVGQTTGCLTGLACLPLDERQRPTYHRGGVRAVIAFGGWRAVQQFVRPTTLNAARWLVLVAAGAAAVGQLEAARILVAPAMLLVQGVGSYLFASYAVDREGPVTPLLRRADRAAAVMLTGSLVVTAVITVVLPVLGPLVTGPGYDLPVAAVLGWGLYAASCAAVLPYGSLAAVRGRQAAVLVLRVVDSALALTAVAIALVLLGAGPGATPWLLAVGSFVGGLLCRQLLLVPLTSETPGDGTGRPAGVTPGVAA